MLTVGIHSPIEMQLAPVWQIDRKSVSNEGKVMYVELDGGLYRGFPREWLNKFVTSVDARSGRIVCSQEDLTNISKLCMYHL